MHAILATSDKTGIVEFAGALSALGWTLIATSGTALALAKSKLPVITVADFTGSPEMFGGRVRTFHPKVLGGLLYRRGAQADETEAINHNILPIDLVACNFYPLPQMPSVPGPVAPPALDLIDIGGPALVRAAAKNYPAVIPLVDFKDYEPVLSMLRAAGGLPRGVGADVRLRLAVKAFEHTQLYDAAIAKYLGVSLSGRTAESSLLSRQIQQI